MTEPGYYPSDEVKLQIAREFVDEAGNFGQFTALMMTLLVTAAERINRTDDSEELDSISSMFETTMSQMARSLHQFQEVYNKTVTQLGWVEGCSHD